MGKRKTPPQPVRHVCRDDFAMFREDRAAPCECALGADHTHDQWADSGLPDGHVFEIGGTDE